MSYFYTSPSENAVPAKSFARPKKHGPGSRLSNLGHRYYQPETGRWASRDIISEKGWLCTKMAIEANSKWKERSKAAHVLAILFDYANYLNQRGHDEVANDLRSLLAQFATQLEVSDLSGNEQINDLAFVSGNPLNFTDYLGLDVWSNDYSFLKPLSPEPSASDEYKDLLEDSAKSSRKLQTLGDVIRDKIKAMIDKLGGPPDKKKGTTTSTTDKCDYLKPLKN